MYTLIFELVLILKWNLDCNKVSISQKNLHMYICMQSLMFASNLISTE